MNITTVIRTVLKALSTYFCTTLYIRETREAVSEIAVVQRIKDVVFFHLYESVLALADKTRAIPSVDFE